MLPWQGKTAVQMELKREGAAKINSFLEVGVDVCTYNTYALRRACVPSCHVYEGRGEISTSIQSYCTEQH